MLKINKEAEPNFLLEFKRKNSPRTWEDYSGEIKNKIKAHILECEQNSYCVYCEKRIYENNEGHIEHVKPRDMFPQYFQEYHNLLVSCNEKHSCGMAKGRRYSEEFINPVIDNPSEYFTFNLATGEVVPVESDTENINHKKAVYTIEILNLNSYTLTEARKNLIEILEVYRVNYQVYDEFLQFYLDDGYNFPSLIRHYMTG